MTDCKQSTCHVWKIALLTMCQNALRKKLPVEPRTFVLHLTQPSVSPATMSRKRRKLDSGKHLPAELPEAPSKELRWDNSPSIGELHPPAKQPIFEVEACAPMNEEVP